MKLSLSKLIIFFCIVILIGIIIYVLITSRNKSGFMNDYFDCYLKLTDINPQFVGAYMKYDNKHVANGVCENARLHVIVEPCPTDSNGIPNDKCKETAVLTSSKGNPVNFPYNISPMNVGKYFGINV